jgi:uncharacterized alkaline shock family protein YloU
MIYKEENEKGSIEISRRVVESFCGRVIDGFDGRIFVSDRKGKLRRGAEKNPEEETGFARARLKDGKLNIKLYLIFRFGTSIRDLARALVAELREKTPQDLGFEVGLVKMVFVGTLSEKVSKRNIVFVDDGELRELEAEEPEEGDGDAAR